MTRATMWLGALLAVLLIGGFVALSIAGRSTGEYAAFALAAVAAVWAGVQARSARDASEATTAAVEVNTTLTEATTAAVEVVREQTNGALNGPLADLVAQVAAVSAWIEGHDEVTKEVLAQLAELRGSSN